MGISTRMGRDARFGDRLGLRRDGCREGKFCFVLDRCQTTESVLTTLGVVVPFDPESDLEPELLTGCPALEVGDIAFQEPSE